MISLQKQFKPKEVAMKRKISRCLSVFLAVLTVISLPALLMFSISGNEMPFTGKAAEYCNTLMEQGFPEDYAISLTKLHLLHPNWSFVPLKITETNSDYTWSHVIQKETESPKINLVSASSTYSAYWHEINRETYDSGWYQPSAAAVKYFMDPRNFLNEADIFQFYDLSDGILASEEAVDAVLAGSFMENAELENGKTYTEYLIEIGEEIGIDAVYLAVKLRQEQGTGGTSPIISGTCGNTLWEFYNSQKQYTNDGKPVKPPTSGEIQADLLALNGLYNPFNLNATGDGVFAIYKNAMLYAQNGTASMREEWGGSPAWDTDWKGIYGGALYIKEKYVDQYQSTIYLQKFDVDGRKSFSNQYMQNIFGAVSEGRSFYQAFAANDTLDADCQFLIPVYEGMPKAVCEDPANGSCPSFAPASARYETTALVTSPSRYRATNDGIYGEITVVAGNPLTLSGEFTHSFGIRRLEYSFDGVTWVPCSDSGILELNISENLPPYGEHLLLIRGEAAYDSNDAAKKLNRYFLCGAFQLIMLPPPSVTLTLQAVNQISEKKYYQGDTVTLPVSEDAFFAGWLGSDGSIYPSGGSLTLQNDVSYTALFVTFQTLEGAAVSTSAEPPKLRFSAVIPDAQFQALSAHAAFSAVLTRNSQTGDRQTVQASQSVQGASGTLWRKLTVDSAALATNEYRDSFSAEFFLTVSYSDGTSKIITATGDGTTRSVHQVAEAALADRTISYSTQIIGNLQAILS